MEKKQQIKKWQFFFKDTGLNEIYVEDYVDYISKLIDNNAAVIFEFRHLSRLVGINEHTLAKIINSPKSFYRSFQIPKRNGGIRQIDAPYPSLLHIQRWIYKNILSRQDVHKAVQGYIPQKSIITNAQAHLNQKAFLRMDLKDFFPSIQINWVLNFFSGLGYSKDVSFYLASLCCHENHLAQGAATSPCLSNILCRNLDNRLYGLARSYNLNYTRYADDLAFSGSYIPHQLTDIISIIVEQCGHKINKEKTFLSYEKGKRILTGISISGDTLKVPKKFKRDLRKEAHYVCTYGLISHITKKNITNQFYLESLYGKVLFWLNVEPENETAKKYRTELKKIMSMFQESALPG